MPRPPRQRREPQEPTRYPAPVTAAERLLELPPWARHRGIILYAASPAQRLMDWHDSRPESEQRPYSRSWKPALHAVWGYAGGDDQAWYPISQAIGSYLMSPQNHIDGQDGPDDADQDEVAAVIFAANAVLHGLPGFAELAAGRATDAIDNRWYAVDDGRLRRELAAEVDRQRSSLELILRAGADRAAWRSGAPGWLVAALRDGPTA